MATRNQKKTVEYRIDYFRNHKNGEYVKISELTTESEFYDLIMRTMMFYDKTMDIKHMKIHDLRSQIYLIAEIIKEWNKYGKSRLYPYLDIDTIISFKLLLNVCMHVYKIETENIDYNSVYYLQVFKRKTNGKKIKFILEKN